MITADKSTQPLVRLLRNRTIRDTAIVFGSTMIVNVFNYLYHMLCSRILGVAAYGSLATLVAGYSIINSLAIVLNLTIVKLSAELRAADDFARLRGLLQTMTRVCLFLAGGLCIVFWCLTPFLASYIHIDALSLIVAIIAACAAITVPATRGILQGMQDYTGLAVATSLECIVRLFFGVGLAYLGYGAGGAMAGFAAGSILSIGYSLFAVRRHFRTASGIPAVPLDSRRILITSGGVALATFALTVLGFIDVVLAKHFFNATDAGLYGVLSLTGKVIMFSVSFVPTILLPKAVDKAARGESTRQTVTFAIAATVALSGISLLLYGAAPALVIRILAGGAYIAAAPDVLPYGIATSLLAATTLASTYLIGLHRFAFVPRLLIVSAAEIAAICALHTSIGEVVTVVIVANLAGLLVTVTATASAKRAKGTGEIARERTASE